MVNLTSAAATKLQSIMDEKKLSGYGLRVFVSGGGCGGMQYGMGFDAQQRTGDSVHTVEGIMVYVDPMSAQYLDGVNIDYVDALMGGGFKIENPNAVSTCACGQSFKTEGEGAVKSSCHH
jgi:iron-sulfur cluster assembly accessory protein